MGTRGKRFSGRSPLNALVLDASSRAAVETIQSLAKRGVQVDAAAERDCLAFRSKRLRGRLLQPSGTQTDAFLHWLLRTDRDADYSLIVPSTEISLRHFLSLPESDLLRQKAVLSSNASMQITLDKSLTVRLASELRIPAPKTTLVQSQDRIPACDFYPIVLKPVSSLVYKNGAVKQVHAHIAQNEFERQEALHKMLEECPVLQQELVSGHGVGIEMLYCHGKLLWYFCHERLHEGSGEPGLGGASSYRQSIAPNRELLTHAVAFLDAIKWHGVAMVEFKVSENGPFWLMEINPRLWGSLSLSIDAGVDFPYGLLCIAAGREVPSQPEYQIGYRTRLLFSDLEWIRNRLSYRLDEYIILEVFKLLRPLAGRESWDYFDWGDLAVSFADFRHFVSETLKFFTRKLAKKRQRKTARKLHYVNLERFVASKQKPRSLLFLCYGNICRSPVAESLMRLRYPDFRVQSAGFHHTVGRASPSHIQKAANSLGIALSNCLSQRVTADMIRDAEVVFLHDLRNYDDFCREFPNETGKVLFLGLFLNPPMLEIQDPYDLDDMRTAEITKQISDAADVVANKFQGPQTRGDVYYQLRVAQSSPGRDKRNC